MKRSNKFMSPGVKNLIHLLRMNPSWTSEVNRPQGNWFQCVFIFSTSFQSLQISLNGFPLTLHQIVFPHMTEMYTSERQWEEGWFLFKLCSSCGRLHIDWIAKWSITAAALLFLTPANMHLQDKLAGSLPVTKQLHHPESITSVPAINSASKEAC